MQRSRQEIVDDGRRHCYLTPPLHVLPGALLWILGDTQKSRLKWVVTRICYMRKARRSCQGVQGQKIPCHLFIYIVPYCVYVFIWSTLIRWVHIWVFCSVFLGVFFAYKTFSAIYAISPYRCHFSIAILWLLHRKKTQRCHTSKNGGRNEVSCINVTRFKLFFIFNHVLNTNAKCEFLCQCWGLD